MGVLIDASVLIEHERGRIDFDERVRDREDEQFFLSVVTASELIHGVHRAHHAPVRARRSAWVEGILGTSVDAKTMPVIIADTLGEMEIYWQDMSALATLIALPGLLFAFFMQRYLVGGLTAGAIK
jgi:predicted nucleic acid-binding protein